MAQFEGFPEPSAFVKSMTELIDRRVAAYAELFGAPPARRGRGRVAGAASRVRMAGRARVAGRARPARQRWQNEPELLEQFEFLTSSVISRYEPPGVRRRGDGLVFRHLYARARHSRTDPEARDEVPVVPLAALLAAELEFRGPLQRSHTQNGLLAAAYEQLGGTLVASGLPAHAALSFRRALFLHRQTGDSEAEERCGLAQMRARWRASPPGWQRTMDRFSDLFCGYGYRPFRMLGWIAVQLAAFTAAVTLVTGASFTTNLYLCLTNYLNPLGLTDTGAAEQPARALFVVEAYLGTISMSVFFALLVRRWFRL